MVQKTNSTFLILLLLLLLREELWNPADNNLVQGNYPSPSVACGITTTTCNRTSAKGNSWTVAGSDGWGRIEEIFVGDQNNGNSSISTTTVPSSADGSGAGSSGELLQVGDYVSVERSESGTMRSSLWLPMDHVIKIDRGYQLHQSIGSASAATLFQVAGTAYNILHNFVRCQKGDIIIQNAGNSTVGYMISQLATHKGIHVVSIVRKKKNRNIRNHFFSKEFEVANKNVHGEAGRHIIVTEEDLLENEQKKENMKELQLYLKKHLSSDRKSLPLLAINAVGGSSASDILVRLLRKNGTMVTYGGMSKKPITINTGSFIFKNLHFVGYWHSYWRTISTYTKRKQLINEIVNAVLDNHDIQSPEVQVFPLCQINDGIQGNNNNNNQRQPNNNVLISSLEKDNSDNNSIYPKKVVFDCRCS